MESRAENTTQTLAAIIHLSTFSKYFVPLGNFIFPLIIWFTGKKDRLLDHHGRQALNFQLSIFFYMVLVVGATVAAVLLTGVSSGLQQFSLPEDFFRLMAVAGAIPLMVVLGIGGILLLALFILEVVCVISAAMKAAEGIYYKYPLTIPFLGSNGSPKQHTSQHSAV